MRRFLGELSEMTSESQPAHTFNEWYQLLHIVVFLLILKFHKSSIAEMSEGDEEG